MSVSETGVKALTVAGGFTEYEVAYSTSCQVVQVFCRPILYLIDILYFKASLVVEDICV